MSDESNSVYIPPEVSSILIPEQKFFDGLPFPLVVSPSPSHSDKDNSYWVSWITDNVNQLKLLLVKHGAILFRDFPIEDAKCFDDFAGAFDYPLFPFFGGIGVRRTIVGNVLSSTEAPSESRICFHHEMAHVPNYPKIIFFYCDIPSTEGGETPLLLSHVLLEKMEQLEPQFTARLEAEGLRYIRVAPEETDFTSGVGRSWKSTFFTENKEEAELKAREVGYDVEWLEDDSMRTMTEVLPAIRVNDKTGRRIWFNTAFAYRCWQDSRNNSTKAVMFPNGDYLPASAIDTLEKTADEVSVSFKWHKQDTVLIDNMQVMHARNNFTPPRRILVCLFKD